MSRVLRPHSHSDTKQTAPSEAELFARAILGKSVSHPLTVNADGSANREQLKWLAQISTDHERELRRLQSAEAEARRKRDLLIWLAQISTEHEHMLRKLLSEEAEARNRRERAQRFAETLLEGDWDPSKHPRLGGPPNAGWWAKAGGGAGGSGQAHYPLNQDVSLGISSSHANQYLRSIAARLSQNDSANPAAKGHGSTYSHASQRYDDGASGSSAPLTRESVLNYFRLLYGENGERLLNAFLKSGGLLKIERPWFGNSALDTRNAWRPHQIRLHEGLNPIEAARELMERLIEASGLTEVRQHLNHSGFANIEALIASYKQSVKQAAAAVALASELYLSGVSIASEGADWVITIHDLSEGNYYAAIGLLPLLPATVGKTGVVLKHGRQSLRISAESIRGVKALPVRQLIELLESTRNLSRNLVKTGIKKPAGSAAHPIVPSALKLESAKKSAILAKFGINLDNAANGAFLPTKFEDAVQAVLHNRDLHSKTYCDEIFKRLERVRNKEEALLVLNQIRKELLAGTFPF